MKAGTNLFRGLAAIGLSVLMIGTAGLDIASDYRTDIDKFLGTDSYSKQESDAAYTYEASMTADELIEDHSEVNERLEEEGAVLLKNDDALPFSEESPSVTLFGMRSYVPQFGGTVNAQPAASQNVYPDEAFNARGITCNPDMIDFYAGLYSSYTPGTAKGANNQLEETGAVINEVPASEYDSLDGDFSAYSDAAIIFLGRDCGEANDYYPGEAGIADPSEFSQSTTGNILGLSDDEKDLIRYVESQDEFKRIIVILNATTTMEVEELEQDDAIDSILWIGTPGNDGFYGVADLLLGKVSPSGGLPDTYAVNTANSPAAQNMGVYVYTNASELDDTYDSTRSLRNSWYLAEDEGIYIGYKYYETRYYDSIANPSSGAASAVGSSGSGGWDYDSEVTYPFGYGLSYTEFTEEIVSADIHLDGSSSVDVKVTNTGDCAGKDQVQLYVHMPYEAGQVEKAAIQLVGYAKTGDAEETANQNEVSEPIFLNPGESETVTITFEAFDYASYDENEDDGAYILDAGTYYFAVGNGAHEALENAMTAEGLLTGDAAASCISVENADRIVLNTTANGTEISNQLQDMELNNLGVEVTYLSRSDWSGTFPSEENAIAATEEMMKGLGNAFYEAGEVENETVSAEADADLSIIDAKDLADYDDPVWDQLASAIPTATAVDGVAVGFQRIAAVEDIDSPAVTAMGGIVGLITRTGRYNAEGSRYYLAEDDASYGYETNTLCTEPVVAATFSHRMAELEGELLGNDVLWTGMVWWYGVGMNIHRTPYNGRNNEYYSEDSVLMGNMGKDVTAAAASFGGIIGCKHFAFNDQEANREGLSVYMTEQAARENELRGFRILIEAGNTGSVMTAYNRAGSVYSSAHKGLITGILRDEWGYNKIVITDMLHGGENYMLIREALDAGTDMMMSSNNLWPEFTEEALDEDPYLASLVNRSWKHILYTVANSAAMNGMDENSSITRLYPWWECSILAVIGVGGLLFAGGLLLMLLSVLKKNKKSGEA